jgi:serine/threonine-protein kinase
MSEAARTWTGIDANQLGKYSLIAGLGRGGMAAVHLAVVHGPSSFNKLVVIKQIHPQYAEDAEVLGMFLDEAKLAARLNHPNVVQTNEVGQEGESHYLVMEYLDGQPLNRITNRFSKRGGLPLQLHLQLIVDLLGGLHYAHELTDYDGSPLGVVHRDITPQNIFVTYDGVVKIVDFGIAKAKHAVTETKCGIIKGKIAYMAPEQARSEEVDRRADIFAVGVMLWEAATGARPWKGVTEITLLRTLLAGQFPSARSVKPDLAPALDAIIAKALAGDRADRYATAADLQAALEAYLETTGERPQPRELGRLIRLHFAAERAQIKAIIEEQLQTRKTLPIGAALPLPLIDPVTSPDGELPGRAGDSRPSLAGDLSLDGSSATRPARTAGVRRGLFVGGTGLLVGAVVLAVILAAGRPAPPRVAAAAAAPVPVAPSLAATTVALRVSATPASARIFLDDSPLAGNPFQGALARDGARHLLRIEAPGFVTWSESVTLDRDGGFEVTLTAAPAAPAASSSQSSPSQPGARGPTSDRHRKLDATNPYPR